MYVTLLCETCFEVNECEVVSKRTGDQSATEEMLVWFCPNCSSPHQMETHGDAKAAVRKYNDNIRDLHAKLNEALRSNAPKPDEELTAFQHRLAAAQEKDKQAGFKRESKPSFTQRVMFGHWLRRNRTAEWVGLTKEEAAHRAGISSRQWDRYELGQSDYDETKAKILNAAVNGIWSRASEIAGFERSAEDNKNADDAMRRVLQRYLSAINMEDEVQWMTASAMARKQYRRAKFGEEISDVMIIPDRAHALSAMLHAVRALRKLEKIRHSLSVLRAALRTEASETQRYIWIRGLVMQVLTDEQAIKLVKEVAEHLRIKQLLQDNGKRGRRKG